MYQDLLKQREADELERLRIKCDDGRTWDPTTGVTIERSTGLPVVRTTYAFGFQYSANPVTGKPWSEVQVSKVEKQKERKSSNDTLT